MVHPWRHNNFRCFFVSGSAAPPEDCEKRAFKKCLYWQARLLAPVLRMLKSDFFASDFKFIRYLGAATDVQEATVDLLNFRDAILRSRGSWRTDLKIRVSGRKASRLVHELFRAEREAGGGLG
jgi:hypothetical protein